MISHKNCTHPATTLARRACPLRKGLPPVEKPKEPPHVEVAQEPERKVLRMGGKPLTREAYQALRVVDGREVRNPLVRILGRYDWDYQVIGRDESGEYVRAYPFHWEDGHDEFMALPARRLA